MSWVLQRMSDIQISPASNEDKMKEAQHVMDDMATRFLEKDAKNKAVSKMRLGFFLSTCSWYDVTCSQLMERTCKAPSYWQNQATQTGSERAPPRSASCAIPVRCRHCCATEHFAARGLPARATFIPCRGSVRMAYRNWRSTLGPSETIGRSSSFGPRG